MGEKIRKATRTYNELSAELGRQPTDEEVAERLGWSVLGYGRGRLLGWRRCGSGRGL
jgi:DNA-directed RNA polymerase specialized sigma subunit